MKLGSGATLYLTAVRCLLLQVPARGGVVVQAQGRRHWLGEWASKIAAADGERGLVGRATQSDCCSFLSLQSFFVS